MKQDQIVEYYRGFSGYDLPLRLTNKITKEEAEAGASNASFYIAYMERGKLIRVVKMFRGSADFEHMYQYYPNGKLKRVEGKNAEGVVKVEEFDENGQRKESER